MKRLTSSGCEAFLFLVGKEIPQSQGRIRESHSINNDVLQFVLVQVLAESKVNI
jgi:hypothetical protein